MGRGQGKETLKIVKVVMLVGITLSRIGNLCLHYCVLSLSEAGSQYPVSMLSPEVSKIWLYCSIKYNEKKEWKDSNMPTTVVALSPLGVVLTINFGGLWSQLLSSSLAGEEHKETSFLSGRYSRLNIRTKVEFICSQP